eukprot:COSAG04_NODE_61_length_30104_cov_10.610932_6_plen_474_part_00
MSAGEVVQKEQGKKQGKEPQRPCWICLDDGPDGSGERPQPTGCACRGGATTHAHVGCLAKFAQEKVKTWLQCPTCGQHWTGPVMLALSRRRHELAAGLPETAAERLTAASNLVQTLREAGQYEEALRLGRTTLTTIRQVLGPEDPLTLTVMQDLAATHGESGDPEAALALETELVATKRRVHGAEHEDTLNAIGNLALTYSRMGNPHLALALDQEALNGRRRTLGDGHADTLLSISNLAGGYNNLYEYERALPLRKEAAQGRRQLLGSQHPDTLVAVGDLGVLLRNMGDHAAAAPLLQEAVEGLGALEIGGYHLQQLEQYKRMAEDNARCLADPGTAAEFQRFLRHERLEEEASLPTAGATVVGVQSRPELNGATVTIRRFLTDQGRYTVLLPLTADGKQEKINLKPTNLVLAEGSAVVATGLTGAPELNGQRGIVEGWLEGRGRYAVRLEDKRRKKAANLRPENCRADVLAL